MHPDSGLPPEDDIQHALEQAKNPAMPETMHADAAPGEVLVESGKCPLIGLRYAMAKCGLMAEKYPWQSTVALLLCVGCAYMCTYFGATMLAGLVLYAVYGDD